MDVDEERMEVFELEKHPYYIGVQFHPEYLSRPFAPSPPFLGLILASKNKLKSYFAKGCRLSPREHSDFDDSEDDMLDISTKQLEVTQIHESDSSSAYSSSSVM